MASDIKNIKEGLSENEILGLVIPDIEYKEMLIKVAGILSKDYNKILYISVNKPYETLVSEFKQNKINTYKFYFIDCITRTSKDALPTKNCIYVSSPNALDEIQMAILDFLRKQEINVVLIDSPSSLLMYYEYMDVLQFMHRLTTVLMVANCKGIFPFKKESAGSLRRSIEMFTNKTVHLGSNISDGGVLSKALI